MAEKKKVLVLVAPFYRDIADMLRDGCTAALHEAGVASDIREVPGALELPLAIRIACEQGGYDGYVALGCVIRGETSHYDTVANESARGLMQLGLDHGCAIGNGILTVENRDQAMVRADPRQKNKGADAAQACLALMALRDGFAETSGDGRAPTFLPDSEQFDIAGSQGTRSA